MANNNVAILAIFVIAVATLIAIFLVNGQILLYLNGLGVTTVTDPSFYLQLSATQSLFRIPSSLILGWCSAYYGPTRILTSLLLVASVGIITIIVSRPSPTALFIGYMLFCESYTTRQFRISILTDVVSPANRTPVIVLHSAMRQVAYMLGPSAWLLIQKWKASVTVSGYVIDRFTISHASSFLIFLTTALLIHLMVSPNSNDEDSQLMEVGTCETTPLQLHSPESNDTAATTPRNLPPSLPFPLILSLRSSCIIVTAVTEVSFQPIMVDIFGAGDAELGQLYVLAAVIGITISCVQSWISHRYTDHTVIVVGVSLIMLGQVLNMPVFGTSVQKWQIVMAYILSSRSVVLPSAVMSLFTKRTSSKAQKEKGLAVCNSSGHVVKAAVRYLLAHHILYLFGKRFYLVLSVPLLVSTVWFLISWQRCKNIM